MEREKEEEKVRDQLENQNQTKCPRFDDCPTAHEAIENRLGAKGCTGEFIRKCFINYCLKGDWENCVRKKMADSGKKVPPNMIPSGEFVVDEGSNKMVKCRNSD